jgi:uncharacterized protein (TIGR02996 family)
VLDQLLQGVVDEPQAEDRWAVLADWLEEHDDPRRADLLRLHRRLLATCCEPEKHPERAQWQARIVALLAEGIKPCVPQRTILLGRQKIPMTFSWVPPGSFLMGSPPQEEGRQDEETLHRVTLSRGFWMGIYPVTQAQWLAAMKTNPSKFKGDDRPVETVSWEDCKQFCKTLGETADRQFRLPTEAEWEWACRAGTTTAFHFGLTISTDQANYDGTTPYGGGCQGVFRQETTAVDSFPANAWGLSDLHGNVWEWCEDWYGPSPGGDGRDPVGDTPGRGRVLRGGCWRDGPQYSRSAQRYWFSPTFRDVECGCRLVLCPD